MCLNRAINLAARILSVSGENVKSTRSQNTPWSCPQKHCSKLRADPSQFTYKSSLLTMNPEQPIQRNGIYHQRSVSITLSGAYSSLPRKPSATNLRLMAFSASRIVGVVADIVRTETSEPDQRPLASVARYANETLSRGSLHLVC